MISQSTLPKIKSSPAYSTYSGAAYCGDSLQLLQELPDESINLVITSPPFALQRQKEYGNKEQHEYVEWLAEFARLVYKKLRDDGSFVLDLGGAYQQGRPIRSLYNFRILLKFCDELGFYLAEEFYWYNPSKLPSPIEWVNKRKLRAKDSVNTVWWFSKSEWPKANVSNVLTEYSERMKKLLSAPDQFYTPARRPSGHDISDSFGKDNGGAIPSNLLQIPNTESNSQYLQGCKAIGVKGHPARFPAKLPQFFIRFLTDPGDVVLDIFAGSNTTGAVAEAEGRKWLAFENRSDYLATSSFRFVRSDISVDELKKLYDEICSRKKTEIIKYMSPQPSLFTIMEGEEQLKYAVLPHDMYVQLVEGAEMLQDIRDFDDAMGRIGSGEEELIPAHVPYAILDGENPVKVWRDYRGLSQQELAQAAGISTSYLSQIETGKRVGKTAVLSAIAHALDLTLDDIVR